MKAIKRMLVERPEPLLLVVPSLLFILYKIFVVDADSMIARQRAYVQFAINNIFWVVFVCIVVPAMLHYLLRASKKWDTHLCRLQVYVTILLLTFLFLLVISNFRTDLAGATVSNYDWGSFWKGLTISWADNKLFTLLFSGLFLLQLLFTTYFLISIFKKEKYV